MSDFGTLREKLPWFPIIDYSRCGRDLECLVYCPHDVFDWDADTGRPVVAHPYSCVPGCNGCAQRCTNHAISLPTRKELRAALRRLRAEARNLTPLRSAP